MKKTFLSKLLLAFSAVLLFVYGVIYACADGDWGWAFDSNFAPETFVDKSYTPLFLSECFFYTVFDTQYNSRFNDEIVQDWSTFLKGKMDAFPWWAMEGGANVYSTLILGLFMQGTKADAYITRNSSIRDSQLGQFDLWAASADQLYAWVKLSEKQNSTVCTFPDRVGYSLGLLFYEQLLGKYGQPKAIAWMEGSAATNWQNAVESVYGMKIDDWYKTEAIPYLMSEMPKVRRDWPRN